MVITFQETSKPYRNVFLTGITWGLIRVLKDDEIDDISCLMELNPISEEVSINTMDYTIHSKSEYAFEFQKRQKQTLYFDEAILGVFYLKDGKQLGAKRYSVETQDAVGILDNNQFMVVCTAMSWYPTSWPASWAGRVSHIFWMMPMQVRG